MNEVKMIVDAVNCLCGNLTLDNSMFCNSGGDVVATRCGDYLALKSTAYIPWGAIYTIEEFNQCVKEMSLHNVTQEQLDAYVAADKEVLKPVFNEWKNGDECIVKSYVATFIGKTIGDECAVMDIYGCVGIVDISDLSRPLTQAQKAAREKTAFITECSRLMHETNESELNDITIGALFDAGVRLSIGDENAL